MAGPLLDFLNFSTPVKQVFEFFYGLNVSESRVESNFALSCRVDRCILTHIIDLANAPFAYDFLQDNICDKIE